MPELTHTAVNALLVELDGFAARERVVVLAATNTVQVLDSALTRPGEHHPALVPPLLSQLYAHFSTLYSRYLALAPITAVLALL